MKKPKKRYGFFVYADIPIYFVANKRTSKFSALHWYDLDKKWVHDESNFSDLLYDIHDFTYQLSFLEWIQHLRVNGIVRFPRHLVSYSNKMLKRLEEIFHQGDKLRQSDIDLFKFDEIESLEVIISFEYEGDRNEKRNEAQ